MNKFFPLFIVLIVIALCQAQTCPDGCVCTANVCTECSGGYSFTAAAGQGDQVTKASCTKCTGNNYSAGGKAPTCEACQSPKKVSADFSKCFSQKLVFGMVMILIFIIF